VSVREAVGLALLLLTLLAAVPAGLFCTQVLAGVRSARRAERHPVETEGSRPPFAVLMPAHDEAVGIGAAIAAVLAQMRGADRLLVVADTCTDATAAVARAAGAEVTERTDPHRRGKGYALDHGVRWLERAPPSVVVIVDADCIVGEQALERLVQRSLATRRPVQALYLMHALPGAPLGQRIAEFAWRVKNRLRPLGSAAFGWPCQLMGTGMAFPWALIQSAPLATGHLVEDMQLGLDLAAAGTPPLFCPQALVTSVFPSDAQGAQSQRTRWEHGHLSVLASVGPRLLGQALKRREPALAAMALDLMIPPLAALVMGVSLLLGIDATWWGWASDMRAFSVSALAMLALVVGVMTAWWSDGRRSISPRELLGLPGYIAAKIPVYVRLFTKRQIEWVRTKRDDRHS
jgi:cellulose synthase/poly-beta-1,6-N-acetylglucosamine synthase-like glycosyltransferase